MAETTNLEVAPDTECLSRMGLGGWDAAMGLRPQHSVDSGWDWGYILIVKYD